MTTELRGWFWYSSKATECRDRRMELVRALGGPRPLRNFALLDDGRTVEYILMTETLQTSAAWDDLVLLGHGRYLRSEVISSEWGDGNEDQ